MDDELQRFLPHPTPQRPLNGISLLLVEDSRSAAQAVRLLALASGARLRRADSLAAAHRHLSGFRPSVVIVDMGLPDGSGAELIAELASADPRVPAVLGTSGDSGMEEAAMAAGADGFLAKPVESLARFQQVLIGLLPGESAPRGPRNLRDDLVAPDPVFVAEDLHRAAGLLEHASARRIAYAAQFIGALARTARDPELEAAALRLARSQAEAPKVARLIAERLAQNRLSA